jgi:hypothetical protein
MNRDTELPPQYTVFTCIPTSRIASTLSVTSLVLDMIEK